MWWLTWSTSFKEQVCLPNKNFLYILSLYFHFQQNQVQQDCCLVSRAVHCLIWVWRNSLGRHTDAVWPERMAPGKLLYKLRQSRGLSVCDCHSLKSLMNEHDGWPWLVEFKNDEIHLNHWSVFNFTFNLDPRSQRRVRTRDPPPPQRDSDTINRRGNQKKT